MHSPNMSGNYMTEWIPNYCGVPVSDPALDQVSRFREYMYQQLLPSPYSYPGFMAHSPYIPPDSYDSYMYSQSQVC